ncbi:uncharacterized protein A4U43_C04F20960 [Asparagus officinalis]|uniref:Uncharacterized protein n=1 Tax=Asparagus officinalis TaxID=4686 RepID=A0A5P1F596_ASPOF|nr:myb-related protein Hv1-like [Asparagus officinalis]ONK72587.1 uncharacterized protein A4U43_C04F20960 [Asparagus officinalis]
MGRSPCCEKAHTNKGAWTKEEDERLSAYIRQHGEGCWRSLPKAAGLLRCGKSCRLRWINYLRPDLKRGNFTEEEDELIIKLHSLLGNKWSSIAGELPGRTDNEIKNYWNTRIKRKLLSQGIDPASHRPLRAPVSDVTISFTKNREDKQNLDFISQEKERSSNSSRSSSNSNDSTPTQCLDLNLELCISPPAVEQTEGVSVKREVFCFDCRLGLRESNGCIKCEGFFGLSSAGVLDFRSFQMK